MIVKDLDKFSLQLKTTLENDPSLKTAKKITLLIQDATYSDGKKLTTKDKKQIIDSLRSQNILYKRMLLESDNSDFLKLVDIISKNVLGGR